MTILAVALLVGGMMMDTRGEALAGDAQSLQGAVATGQPIVLARVSGATAKPTVKITVTLPRRGASYAKGAYLRVHWTWYKNIHTFPATAWEPLNRFSITIIKGRTARERTVVANLGSAHISWNDGGGMNRTWRIPANFATGGDFMVKVKHSSGAAGMAGFFTIR